MGQFGDICLFLLVMAILALPFFIIPRMMKKMDRNPDIQTSDSGTDPGPGVGI